MRNPKTFYICRRCRRAIILQSTFSWVKCPVCARFMKRVEKVPGGYMNPALIIPVKSKKQLRHLFSAESELGKAGVTFDTGSGIQDKRVFYRQWELDWSLKGAKIKNPIRHTKAGYFWGSRGPYKTRAKALQVMRAIYASGYKGRNPSIFDNLFGKPKGLYEQFHENPPKVRKTRIRVPNKGEKLIAIGRLTAVEYQPYGNSKRKKVIFRHKLGDTGSKMLSNKPVLATGANGKGLFVIEDESAPFFSERGIIG